MAGNSSDKGFYRPVWAKAAGLAAGVLGGGLPPSLPGLLSSLSSGLNDPTLWATQEGPGSTPHTGGPFLCKQEEPALRSSQGSCFSHPA